VIQYGNEHIVSRLFIPFRCSQGLKKVVPSPVLKACLEEMAFGGGCDAVFAESDDEEEEEKEKAKKKDTKKSSDPFHKSLCFKAGKTASNTLYYVDHSKLKNNGNGLEPDARNELHNTKANTEAEEAALKTTLKSMTAETAKLLSEPTNEEATARLETEESALVELKAQVEASRGYKTNEKEKKKLTKDIQDLTAQWRKRKRMCIDFLMNMEESTEGTVSVKKTLAGDGPLGDIETDESVLKAATAFATNKRNGTGRGTQKSSIKKKPLKKKQKVSNKEEADELPPTESFVGVIVDSQGLPARVHADFDKA
jgi:hypothetical protein